jgi:hypothetical protein
VAGLGGGGIHFAPARAVGAATGLLASPPPSHFVSQRGAESPLEAAWQARLKELEVVHREEGACSWSPSPGEAPPRDRLLLEPGLSARPAMDHGPKLDEPAG